MLRRDGDGDGDDGTLTLGPGRGLCFMWFACRATSWLELLCSHRRKIDVSVFGMAPPSYAQAADSRAKPPTPFRLNLMAGGQEEGSCLQVLVWWCGDCANLARVNSM